jgi:hypothetical protein
MQFSYAQEKSGTRRDIFIMAFSCLVLKTRFEKWLADNRENSNFRSAE